MFDGDGPIPLLLHLVAREDILQATVCKNGGKLIEGQSQIIVSMGATAFKDYLPPLSQCAAHKSNGLRLEAVGRRHRELA